MDTNKLIDVLRRKYKTPEAVLARLGFDEEGIETMTAEEILAKLKAEIIDLPIDQHDQLLEGLREAVAFGSLGDWAAEGSPLVAPPSASAEDRRRLAQDRSIRAAIRANPQLARDASLRDRAAASFARRFPVAAKIGNGW
jgi:hypothetical protein